MGGSRGRRPSTSEERRLISSCRTGVGLTARRSSRHRRGGRRGRQVGERALEIETGHLDRHRLTIDDEMATSGAACHRWVQPRAEHVPVRRDRGAEDEPAAVAGDLRHQPSEGAVGPSQLGRDRDDPVGLADESNGLHESGFDRLTFDHLDVIDQDAEVRIASAQLDELGGVVGSQDADAACPGPGRER